MSETIDISGLDKAELLAALYNAATPVGLGFLQASAEPMTADQAREVIAQQGLSFDYLAGRPLKSNLEGDEFDPWGYDRDQGQGRAAGVVERIRNGEPEVQVTKSEMAAELDKVKKGPDTKVTDFGIHLGLDDELRGALDDVTGRFEP